MSDEGLALRESGMKKHERVVFLTSSWSQRLHLEIESYEQSLAMHRKTEKVGVNDLIVPTYTIPQIRADCSEGDWVRPELVMRVCVR